MKYILQTNADNGDSFYSEPFDTIEKAIEEMAYEWRLLPYHSKSEIRRRGYLSKDKANPYMVVIRTVLEVIDDSTVHTYITDMVPLAEMIAAKEREEEEA